MPCSTCDIRACAKGGALPETCAANLCEPGKRDEARELYTNTSYHDIMRVALNTYRTAVANKWPRLQEVIYFAHEMKFCRIGIASCISYAREAAALANVLRVEGFEVIEAICKIGGLHASDVKLLQEGETHDAALCNPVMQADALNRSQTDMNLIVGLCLGHDMLFNKHSQALCTTLTIKDQSAGGATTRAQFNENLAAYGK